MRWHAGSRSHQGAGYRAAGCLTYFIKLTHGHKETDVNQPASERTCNSWLFSCHLVHGSRGQKEANEKLPTCERVCKSWLNSHEIDNELDDCCHEGP